MTDTHNGQPATVWMRSIKDHTYGGKAKPPGERYLAHEEMVETIEQVLKFAVREQAPPTAVRQVDTVQRTTELVVEHKADQLPIQTQPVELEDQSPAHVLTTDTAAPLAAPSIRTRRR